MQARKGLSAAVIVVLVGACSGTEPTDTQDAADAEPSLDSTDTLEDAESSPLPPAPLVRFYPIDRMTALGTVLPEARITWQSNPVPMDVLQALDSSITLRTWPELESLPMASTIIPEESPGLSLITFSTTDPLADRWHALYVASLPSGLAWPSYQYRFELPDGAVVIRFRPGSQPSFHSLHMCDRGGGTYSCSVYFTEPVLRDGPIEDLVKISQPENLGLRCDVLVGEPQSFSFTCSGLDPASPFRLDIETGIHSSSDVPLTDLAGNPTPLAYDIAWDAMLEGGPGCWMFIPEPSL